MDFFSPGRINQIDYSKGNIMNEFKYRRVWWSEFTLMADDRNDQKSILYILYNRTQSFASNYALITSISVKSNACVGYNFNMLSKLQLCLHRNVIMLAHVDCCYWNEDTEQTERDKDS